MSVFIIAEAGVNHNGSIDLAFDLVDAAANAGADAIKFQTFRAETLVRRGADTADYQLQATGLSDQFEMLQALELSDENHFAIAARCRECGIEFMSTPFDLQAADFLISLGIQRIKVPSGELTNLPFLRDLAIRGRKIILSTGMATLEEVKKAVKTIQEAREIASIQGQLSSTLTVLHCTSNYPAAYSDINLLAMVEMQRELDLPVGYSDHSPGVEVSIAAAALGATIIEKHLTLDCTLPGPDHRTSLEPSDFSLMVNSIRNISLALGDGRKLPCEAEIPIRRVARRSVTSVRPIPKGHLIQPHDVCLLRPGDGIQPEFIDSVIGRRAVHDIKASATLNWDDIS